MEEVIRKNNLFKYQSNNWLKMHGKVMRRKPFKRKWMYIDEFPFAVYSFREVPSVVPHGDGLIITDPKGGMLEKYGKFLKENGYKIKVFNISNKTEEKE